MTTALSGRRDFSDTLAFQPRRRLGPAVGPDFDRTADPIEQMARADRDDWTLLRLVLCTALATGLLALATSLQV